VQQPGESFLNAFETKLEISLQQDHVFLTTDDLKTGD